MKKEKETQKPSKKADKKSIEIETPIGGGKIDTGNKWLDAAIVLVILGVASIFIYFKYL